MSYTKQKCTSRRYLDNNVADSQETSGALEPDQSSKSLRQLLRINTAYAFTPAHTHSSFHMSVLVISWDYCTTKGFRISVECRELTVLDGRIHDRGWASLRAGCSQLWLWLSPRSGKLGPAEKCKVGSWWLVIIQEKRCTIMPSWWEVSYIFLKAETHNGEVPNVVRTECWMKGKNKTFIHLWHVN